MIRLEQVEPAALLAAHELRGGLVEECGEVARMAPGQLLCPTTLRQPLQRVFADGAQHEEARLAVAGGRPQQALLDQESQPVQDRFIQLVDRADCLDGVQPSSACKDGKAPEEGALVLGEKLVAPVDRPAEGLLALRPVAGAAGEKAKAIAQPGEHGLGRQDVDAGSRELDRQGQSVEAGTDLGYGRSVLVGHLEIRFDSHRALDEERDRLVLREALGTFVEARIGRREGWHRVFALTVDPQGAPAGGQDDEALRGSEQLCDARSRICDLLEIVEDQECSAFAEMVGQGRHG